jgi:hypothetical protein
LRSNAKRNHQGPPSHTALPRESPSMQSLPTQLAVSSSMTTCRTLNDHPTQRATSRGATATARATARAKHLCPEAPRRLASPSKDGSKTKDTEVCIPLDSHGNGSLVAERATLGKLYEAPILARTPRIPPSASNLVPLAPGKSFSFVATMSRPTLKLPS